MYILIGSALLFFVVFVFAVSSIGWLYNVGPKTAQTYAQLSLSRFVAIADTPLASPDSDYVKRWNRKHFLDARGRGPFDPERGVKPLNVYDINGWLLFRDFTVQLSNGRELQARMAASTVLGAPLFSIGVDDHPSDIPTLIAKAKAVARTTEPKLTPVNGERAVVCYAYPALGLLCRDDRDGRLVVIDLFDHTRSELKSTEQGKAESGRRGRSVPWSMYGKRPGAPMQRHLDGFKRYWAASSKLRKSMPNLSNPPAVDGKILDVSLEAQDTGTSCAIAVAQMVLSHVKGFRVPTPAAIASAMDLNAMGVTREGQCDGYEKLTRGHGLTITLDDRPGFADVQREINADRPITSAFEDGERGHARAIVGWHADKGAGEAERFIYVLDPEPVGKGRRYFETWRAVKTVDHIYIVPAPSK